MSQIYRLVILSTALIWTGCHGCHGVDSVISGVILDSVTHKPIPYAFVERKNSMGIATHADSSGEFIYDEGRGIGAGDTMYLFFSSEGYKTVRHGYPYLLDHYAFGSDTIYLQPDN